MVRQVTHVHQDNKNNRNSISDISRYEVIIALQHQFADCQTSLDRLSAFLMEQIWLCTPLPSLDQKKIQSLGSEGNELLTRDRGQITQKSN